jgi:hypothetical protein
MRKVWVLMLSLVLAFSLSMATGCKKKEMTEEKAGEVGKEMKEEGGEKKMEEGGQATAPEEKKAGGY